jgi:hypothetical protein
VEERKKMKITKYNFISIIVTAILCVPATGMEEPTLLNERVLLASQPNPALAGIDKLNIVILRPDTEPNIDGLFWAELETRIIDKLNKSDANLITEIPNSTLNTPELRIYTNMLKLENSSQYVFHIQTSLARAVHMIEGQSPVFKVDLWQTSPIMQAVSEDRIAVEVVDSVLEQVDFFIHAYQEANPPGQKTIIEEPTEANDESVITEHKYVASKSSNVFHRPDCRWARNISPENLIEYKSREEAIQAGKRPCKSCKP